jgi:hypothetical protein
VISTGFCASTIRTSSCSTYRRLPRCGTPAEFDADPDNRLRITIGLHEVADQWLVLHEHHSFPML